MKSYEIFIRILKISLFLGLVFGIFTSCASDDSALKDEVAQLRKELREFRQVFFPSLEDQNEQNPKVTQNKVNINKIDAEELYLTCASCHGDKGDGNGPAAPNLNPKPRNFKSPAEKWKNGKSYKGIIKTLKEGIYPGMAKYDYMLDEEINALAKYVLKLGNQK